jgi:predicted N-formylglutamate amidohydrolase
MGGGHSCIEYATKKDVAVFQQPTVHRFRHRDLTTNDGDSCVGQRGGLSQALGALYSRGASSGQNVHSPISQLITAQDGGCSYEIVSGSIGSGALVLADHASNAMPPEFAHLGMPAEQLRRHIAYDIGVDWLARALAARLEAPAVVSRFSRLLIDPNRGDDDPTLVMRLSDGAIVPGNARIDEAAVAERMRRFSLPYHAAIASVIDTMLSAGTIPAVVSIHSFTPSMKGIARPWHVGILWDSDPRLPLPLLDILRADSSIVTGDNEPYDGALEGDTMSRHCISRGLAHVLIEVRQDLIAAEADAIRWGHRLADDLRPLLARSEMHEIRFFGSRASR